MKNYAYCAVTVLLFSSIFAARRKAQGKLTYDLNWSGGFKMCPDLEENAIDISTLKITKDSSVTTALGGSFEFLSPVISGTVMVVLVEKETPQGKIIAYTLEVPDLCKHIPDEDKPWSRIIDAFKLEVRECPLPSRVYPIDPMKLNFGSLDGILTHENVGEYVATVELMHRGDGLDVVEHVLSCNTFSFSIDETRQKAEDSDE